MARASAEADLDAVKSKKQDMSEVESLRKEIQDLKNSHRASLVAAQQEAEKAVDDHNATKASLEQVKAQLDEHKAETENKLNTSRNDYITMHGSLTELAEEAHKKAADLEAQLSEAQAQLKVKDAELAEAKVCTTYLKNVPRADAVIQAKSAPAVAAPPAIEGLSASKFAQDEEELAPGAVPEAVEGEHDSSSAALASVRQPSPRF